MKDGVSWTMLIPILTIIALLIWLFVKRYVSKLADKRHELDVMKRKYKHESRNQHILKYFSLLDDFNRKANEENLTKFLPLMTEFMQDVQLANGDQVKIRAAAAKASEQLKDLLHETYESFLRIQGETNAIKITASKESLKIIYEINALYKRAHELTKTVLTRYFEAVLNGDSKDIELIRKEVREIGERINEQKTLLQEQFRKEFDEI